MQAAQVAHACLPTRLPARLPACLDPMALHSCLQVNKLDGLQHMHIPSGQTYKTPGMAYVEGDASSGEHSAAQQSMAQRSIA